MVRPFRFGVDARLRTVRVGQDVDVQVLAIGGGASVGKTTASRCLATLIDAPHVVHVDDVRAREGLDVASELVTDPRVWHRSPEQLVAQLLAETRRLHPLIASSVDKALARDRRTVIEGEGVEPALMERWPSMRVRPVYVIADDRKQLRETFASRSSAPRFLALSDREQRSVVEMNVAYSGWLRAEADARGQPWVASLPWDTLPERIVAAAMT